MDVEPSHNGTIWYLNPNHLSIWSGRIIEHHSRSIVIEIHVIKSVKDYQFWLLMLEICLLKDGSDNWTTSRGWPPSYTFGFLETGLLNHKENCHFLEVHKGTDGKEMKGRDTYQRAQKDFRPKQLKWLIILNHLRPCNHEKWRKWKQTHGKQGYVHITCMHVLMKTINTTTYMHASTMRSNNHLASNYW